jgi:hypothetical protein
LTGLFIGLSFAIAGASSDAAVIYTNLGPVGFGYGTANIDSGTYVLSGPTSGFATLIQGLEFQAAVTGPLGSASASLSWMGGSTNAIDMNIYADSGSNTLGTLLETMTSAGSVPTASPSETLTTFVSTLNPVLTAGDNYWAVLAPEADNSYNWDSNNSDALNYMYWYATGYGDNYGEATSESPGLEIDARPLTTPEPGCIALLGSGALAGISVIVRRRARA